MNQTDVEIYAELLNRGVPAKRIRDLMGIGKTAAEIRSLHDPNFTSTNESNTDA